MSATTKFAFSKHNTGYLFYSGGRYWAEDIPVLLANALNNKDIRNLASISMLPDLSWIACMDGGSYLHTDEFLPKVLAHLRATAHQNESNPLCTIRVGPDGQFFVRRKTVMNWDLSPPVDASFRRLMLLGVHSTLEDIAFGTDHNVIFLFANGSFLWDIDESHPINEVLQTGFSAGWQLEAAALSMEDPDQYFLFWGHCGSNCCLDDSIINKVTDHVKNADLTRQQMSMAILIMGTIGAQAVQRNIQQVRQQMADAEQQRLNDEGRGEFNVARLVAWQGGRTAAQVARIMAQFVGQSTPGPRQGQGNMRTW